MILYDDIKDEQSIITEHEIMNFQPCWKCPYVQQKEAIEKLRMKILICLIYTACWQNSNGRETLFCKKKYTIYK